MSISKQMNGQTRWLRLPGMRRSWGSEEHYYFCADTGLEFLLGILGLNPLSFIDNSASQK